MRDFDARCLTGLESLSAEEIAEIKRRKGVRQTFYQLKRRFDADCPEYVHFNDVKKLDLFLWQHRKRISPSRFA